MVELALDPYMLRGTPLADLPNKVARLGFTRLELSPRPDLLPLFSRPRARRDDVGAFRAALTRQEVSVSSVMAVYRWASPDEDERSHAVSYFRKAIELAVDLDCPVLNTEFTGDPARPEASESALWRSLDEVVPILEHESMSVRIEPHPGDFIEDGIQAVEFIRAVDSDQVGFLYCMPHTFHMGGNGAAIIERAGALLQHVHAADSLDHRASSGLRFIVNPPDANVRIHQHTSLGQGDVDFESTFAALSSISFDGLITVCIFGCEDSADATIGEARLCLQRLIDDHAMSLTP